MMFTHKKAVRKDGVYELNTNVTANAHSALCRPIFAELWNNYTFTMSNIELVSTDSLCFKVGNAPELPLNGNAYAINITPDGITVTADSEKNLKFAYFTLLDLINITDSKLVLCCAEIVESPTVKCRAVHLCVFPENELWELDKYLRFFAALKFTHVVLEFWGMLKYDCMAELSWSHAFTKSQVKPIIDNARQMGLEIIPMFNHWGHATGSRVIHGKHVVLDQNPALQEYFSEDGWCWNIKWDKVKALQKQIRTELIELCGDGEYFHIGCDEAYKFKFTENNMKLITDYVNEVSNDLKSVGRRAIMWGDMLLANRPEYENRNYICLCSDSEAEQYMQSHISRDVIIADWQYFVEEHEVETAIRLKEAGFDVFISPWDQKIEGTEFCFKTASRYGMAGILHTTWDTLNTGTPHIAISATCGWDLTATEDKDINTFRVDSASLMRKVYPVNGDYAKAGWSKKQI